MMPVERHQRIRWLFEEAIGRSVQERARFLADQCGGDDGLRGEVEALLRLDSDASSFLQAPTFNPLGEQIRAESSSPSDTCQPGDRLGPYELECVIGSGGMGAVWRAHRRDGQFEQRVAIKLIKRGMETAEILERFRQERQLLATLEHPHIARLYDGGATPDGRPYLVMEYVEGQPLLEYCREKNLSLAERLRLFETVCAAVEYAHLRQIVHRDLKPANLLVTPAGGVKLLDFGIAKLLSPSHSAAAAPRTEAGRRPMTPEYAAPELFTCAAVTAATDVYALGVLLYELLTGIRPLTAGRSTLREIEQAVLHEEPRRPSAALTHTKDHAEDGTNTRATLRRRGRELAGDLDTIVLKALHKDPVRRYASAGALGADIRRRLEGRPVLARPDSLRYRAGKFLRRHRLGVTAAGVLLMLVAVSGGLLLQHYRANLAHQAESRAWLRQFRASVREQIRTTPHERWDYLFRRIDQLADEVSRRSGEREVQRALYLARGEAYHATGRPAAAEPQLRAACDEYAAALAEHRKNPLLGRDALYDAQCDLADALGSLADLWSDQGRFAEAEQAALEAAALTARPPDSGRMEHAQALARLGLVLQRRGDLPGAQRRFEQALEQLTGVTPPVRLLRAQTLAQLARVRHERGDLPAAEQAWSAAAALTEELNGRDSPEYAARLQALAALRHAQGRFDEADQQAAAAVALFERHTGPDSPATAAALREMAALLSEHQQHAQARAQIARAIEIQERWLGPSHPELAMTINLAARIYATEGDYRASRAAAERALAILESSVGDDHLKTAEARITLAYYLRNLQSRAPEVEWRPALAEAGRQVELALATRRRLLGERHELVASALHDLAGYLMATDQAGLERAAELLAQADEIVSDPDQDPPLLALAIRRDRARVASRLGDVTGARDLFRLVVLQAEATLPPDHPQLPSHWSNLANCELTLGNFAAAREQFIRAATHYADPRHPQALIVRQGLIRALFELGEYDAAAAEASEVRAAYLARAEPYRFGLVNSSYWLGRALAAQQRWVEAEPILRAALEIEDQGDRSIPLVRPMIQTELAECLLRLGGPHDHPPERLHEAQRLVHAALESRRLSAEHYRPRAEALWHEIERILEAHRTPEELEASTKGSAK